MKIVGQINPKLSNDKKKKANPVNLIFQKYNFKKYSCKKSIKKFTGKNKNVNRGSNKPQTF